MVSERLESLTADSLVKARGSLGIADSEVIELHQKTFTDEAKRVVMATTPPSLDAAGVARLSKLRDVLAISEEDSRFMTNEIVVPIYCDAIDEVSIACVVALKF